MQKIYQKTASIVKDAKTKRPSDNVDFRDVNEEVALPVAVAEAEEDIQKGNLIENDIMKGRLESWLNG